MAERRGKAGRRLRLEAAARLARVRMYRVERKVKQVVSPDGAADENLEPAAEAAAK